ncbi:MAG: adenylate/guanylate cyclase domain-containing protein [Deltaproteobacteria bacterium]|nr:adenylate/guanylate cyclase domain-containing protein [Deltaproteobacteria bacterium]
MNQDNSLLQTVNNLDLTYKVMIVISMIIVGTGLVLNYLFIDALSESKLIQVKLLGKTASYTITEMALQSIYDRDTKKLDSTLENLHKETLINQSDFLQISVVLLPSGIYFSSTDKTLQNRKAHPSLLKVIDDNSLDKVQIKKINRYRFNNQTVSVLQFLKNITVVKNDDKIRIGATQILFGYDDIVADTKKQILMFCLIILILSNLTIWLFLHPVSHSHMIIADALNQVSKNQLDFRLEQGRMNEIGKIVYAFNQMSTYLVDYFQSLQNSIASSAQKTPKGHASEFSLRKTDLTCLCARIPLLQDHIQKETAEEVAEYIKEFMEIFMTTIQDFGGQVIKVFGNKCYCIFEGMNSIDNAIRAAIKINHKWKDLNHERKVLNRKLMDYGIGLHATETMAGTFEHSFSSYTVIGNSVTKAEYLCSLARIGQTLISSFMMEKSNGSYQHQILSEPKTTLLDENEDIFSILNLDQTSSLETDKAGKALFSAHHQHSGVMESLKENQANKQDFYESSLPDMLEETLRVTPLEPVEENPFDQPEDNEGEIYLEKDRKAFLKNFDQVSLESVAESKKKDDLKTKNLKKKPVRK